METVSRSKELLPLTMIDDRRQAMRRVIGPLCTLAVVEAIDEVSQSQHILDEVAERVSGMSNTINAKLCGEWLSRGYDHLGKRIYLRAKMFTEDSLDDRQKQLFEQCTYNERLTSLVHEGFEAQRNVGFKVALPGMIAVKHGISEVEQLRDQLLLSNSNDAVNIMKHHDFERGLHTLSIARNGIYGPMQQNVLDGHPIFRRGVRHRQPRTSVVDIFSLYEGDRYNISETCRRDLRQSLSEQPDSRGCPVNIRASFVQPDDFSDAQWERMTSGDAPIMSYDESSQKLTVNRSAIFALNGLFVSVIERIPS